MKAFDAIRLGRLPDCRRHVQRVEIAGVDEAVHGAEIDVIGVHVIRPRPAGLPHRIIGGSTHACGFRTHDAVLAIRFVPDGDHGDAAVRGHRASLQLGLGLMRETVPYADGEFFQSKHDDTQIIIQ